MVDTSTSHFFKIIIVGNSGTGKSQLLSRFTRNTFSEHHKITMGAEFAKKTVTLKNDVKVQVQIWDTMGQERYQAVSAAFYRGAVGALLCYDTNDPASFYDCEKWIKQIHHYLPETELAVLLVGTKIDLPQVVTTQDALEFAQKQGLALSLCSAKSGEKVESTFQQLIEEIYSQIEKTRESGIVSSSPNGGAAPAQNNNRPETRDDFKANQDQTESIIISSKSSKPKKQSSSCKC